MERFGAQSLPVHLVEHPLERLQDHGFLLRIPGRGCIVEQQDIAASKTASEARRYAGAVPRHGVKAAARPGDKRQSGASEHRR